MQNKMFRTSLQQDSQEFLRCLLMQIHDETAVEVPSWSGGVAIRSGDTPPGNTHRDSVDSLASQDVDVGSNLGGRNSPGQPKSSPLPRKKGGLVRLSLKQKSSGSSQSLVQSSPTTGHRRFALRTSSSQGKTRGGSEEICGRGQLARTGGSQVSLELQLSDDDSGGGGRGEEGEVYEVDMVTRQVTLHRNCHLFNQPPGQQPQSTNHSGREGVSACSEGETKAGWRKASSSEHQSSPQSTPRLRQNKMPGQCHTSIMETVDSALCIVERALWWFVPYSVASCVCLC